MKTKSIVHHLAQLQFTLLILVTISLVFLTGCETTNAKFKQNPALPSKDSKDVVLREADVLKITFPGAANMDTIQAIRRDGKITLPVIGEVVAAGKTPSDFEKELINLYKDELITSKQITVTVQSSSFPVFVTGAVLKPGKVISDHPMTVLEAIMESGGFDYTRANMKAVRIIRTVKNQTKNYTVNLKGVVNSSQIDIFYLQPDDIVFVPAKIIWF